RRLQRRLQHLFYRGTAAQRRYRVQLPARAGVGVARRRGNGKSHVGKSCRSQRGTGTDVATYTRERPGMSAFALEDGVVYHTYSAYARGLDALWGMYPWLDRAPKGRNEAGSGVWWRRHEEYDA